MITQNYKRLLAAALESTGIGISGSGLIKITFTDINGCPFYLNWSANGSNSSYPATVTKTGTNSKTAAGISVGSGNSPEAEAYYNLEHTITNAAVTVISYTQSKNKYLDYVLEYTVGITNNGSEEIVVREIGYKQAIYGGRYTGGGGNNAYTNISTSNIVLIDRTVLESPITIAPGETGVVVYNLVSSLYGQRTIEGVPIVSFQDGSDEEIAAMIDAAHQGKFDLQKDAGWCVGDYRTIHLDAFTGGGSTSHATQDIDIVISSFDDYNGCGCLFQFDTMESLATEQRMNSSTSSNYGESEMVSTTLPAIEAALPSWLRNALIPFNVLYKPTASSTEASTLANQKLAIRSLPEVYVNASSQLDGTLNQFYRSNNAYQPPKGKGGNTSYYFTVRTPYTSTAMYSSNGSGSQAYSPTAAKPIVIFGCV